MVMEMEGPGFEPATSSIDIISSTNWATNQTYYKIES